jgi:hypothetical protein
MGDQFDVNLEDVDLMAEVELATSLIVAATESDQRLAQDQIDEIPKVAPTPHPDT